MTDPMNTATRRAVVFLFAFTLLLAVANLFWTAHLVQQANHAKCATTLTLATIHVPNGDITPGARAFDLALTQTFAARARQLGCAQENGKP